MGIRRGILIAFFLLIIVSVFSQRAEESFGKNRIQYRQFDWQYLSGENFDLYFYDARKDIAEDALEYLEGEFDRITDMIGYPPYFKTKVFLYNSLVDLRQSNVGLNRADNTADGETEFVKPYVEIAHLGNVQEFKKELLFKISELMVNEMMFGGNLKDIFQNALLLNLPEWFVDGASRYISYGWDITMDDFIYEFIKTRKAKNLSRLTGEEAALAGQSMWNFIAEKFGKSSIANILNYTRVTRNEEKSIIITLGVPFRQLMEEWKAFYMQAGAIKDESYVTPDDEDMFTAEKHKHTKFTTVKISPDGNYLAYAENDRGRFIVKVKNFSNNKEKVILSGGSKVINQRVDYNIPLLSWADENTLGVIGINQGRFVFWLYDLSTNSKIPRTLDTFSNVRSFDFSNNGRLVVVSADVEGQNDIFLLSTLRDRTRRLTHDVYDDLDPTFLPSSNGILFSSNRTSDTLVVGKQQSLDQLTNNYNLFVYDLDTTKNVLGKITNTLSKDYSPKAISNRQFLYLSDQRGVVNLFKYDLDSHIYSQVTNYASSIKKYDFNQATRKLAFVTTKDLDENIFIEPDFNVNRQAFSPTTKRIEIQQAKVIREKRKKDIDGQKEMSIKDLLNQRKAQQGAPQRDTLQSADSVSAPRTLPDSLVRVSDTLRHTPEMTPDSVSVDPGVGSSLGEDSISVSQTDSVGVKVPEGQDVNRINTDDYSFEDSIPTDTINAEFVEQERVRDSVIKETVNTDNYQFEDDPEEQGPTETFLSRYIKEREKARIMGPYPYEPKFSADNLVTSLVIDPMRGLGILIETQMNDMLENYRFFGGIMSTINLTSSDAYAEIQYLPKYIDYSARFDRKSIRWEPPLNSDNSIYSYTLHRLEVGASLPINERMRFTVKPFMTIARSVNLGAVNPQEDTVRRPDPNSNFYAGGKTEIVYDNSVVLGKNIIEGTRGKMGFSYHQGIGDNMKSFGQIFADLRHYQKIYKEITLAVRGFAGSFFGNAPKLYALGGMDNWAFNKTQTKGSTNRGELNPLGIYNKDNQDLLFLEYATNLRGFQYATLFGNNVLLFNAEFRVPLARALVGTRISSNFFRNLQITAFYDIGTSWSGEPPFDSQSSVNYSTIAETPFEINLKNFINPWLYSYGVGLRSVMLGYYVKFDLAWPVENFVVGDPQLQVTLGVDF